MPPALRHTAGCPSGQRERSVKPSAQPTLVRTQHLPPPAETARELGIPGPRGPSAVVSSCVIGGQETPLRGSGYGHIADRIGPEQAVHRTACSWISMAYRLGENPPGPPDYHGWSDELAHAWPTGPRAVENPADIGVSPWTGADLVPPGWRRGASFALRRRVAGRAPAWPTHGRQNATTGHGGTGSQLPVPRQFPLTSY